jgi:hypothetical protein
MLGDDDGLVQGCLTELDRLIEQFDSPDFIYTDTVQFAYPSVYPGEPRGFLQRGFASFFDGTSDEPRLLDEKAARGWVRESLNFRLPFVYNMQQSVISRRIIEELSWAGPFFQSPYPDYYATNALFLNARRILINPTPLLMIGISPKSFGYYFFNDRESDGNAFLNNSMDPELRRTLERVILPGSGMNTSWLAAMETLRLHHGARHSLKVNYRRYRLIQVASTFKERGHEVVESWLPLLNWRERTVYRVFMKIRTLLKRVLDSAQWKAVKSDFNRWWSPYPSYDARKEVVPFLTLLDAFESIRFSDPRFRRTPGSRAADRPSLGALVLRAGGRWFEGWVRSVESSWSRRSQVQILTPADWETLDRLEVEVRMTRIPLPLSVKVYRPDDLASGRRIAEFSLEKVSRALYRGRLETAIPDGPYILHVAGASGQGLTAIGCHLRNSPSIPTAVTACSK